MSVSQTDPKGLPGGDESGTRVIRVGPDRLSEAVGRMVSPRPGGDAAGARRFLEYARANKIRLDGMWSRVDAADRITATVLAVPSPGRTAMVFATHAISKLRAEEIGDLIAAAAETIGELDVNLAQALLDPGESFDRLAFHRGGFDHLADLSYLERARPRPGEFEAPVWPSDVTVEPWSEDGRKGFLDALAGSYEETLDCPGLCGLRSIEDILAGHQGTGHFDPSLWSLLLIDERPAGALLLNPSAAADTVELVYLGLAVFARGRGLARQLLDHGLRQLAERPARRVTLAVDDGNAPALRLYKNAGFRRNMRRTAMIRPV